jgi:hypothetical protein
VGASRGIGAEAGAFARAGVAVVPAAATSAPCQRWDRRQKRSAFFAHCDHVPTLGPGKTSSVATTMSDRAGLSRMRANDTIQLALGVVFGISVFLPWYGTDASNPSSNIDGKRGDLSAWVVHPVLRWVLLAGAIGT